MVLSNALVGRLPISLEKNKLLWQKISREIEKSNFMNMMIWPHTTIILLNEVGVSFCDAFKILFTRPGITNVSTHIVVFSCSSHICGSDSPCPLYLYILNLLWNRMEQMGSILQERNCNMQYSPSHSPASQVPFRYLSSTRKLPFYSCIPKSC